MSERTDLVLSETVAQLERIVSALSKENDEVREIKFPKEEVHLVLGVKQNAICVLKSDCPHQDCVNMGWTTSPDHPIICAHYKVSVEITGTSFYDAEIG